MKKLIPIILSVVVGIAALTGCQGATPTATNAPTATQAPATDAPKATDAPAPAATDAPAAATDAPAAATATGTNVATGLGVYTTIGSSKNAKADANGTAQVDSVIVAVTLDDSGKILKCSIDAAQTAVPFSSAGAIKADMAQPILTKMEKGDAYGMKKASKVGKEWYEQANAFAEYAVGKTVAELTGMKTKKVDDAHPQVPDVAELTSSVTVSVGDFIAALEKAAAKATVKAPASGDIKTGLGVVTSISSSKDAKADADGVGQVDSTIATITLDSSGKIVQCQIDAAQTKVNFNAKGEVTSDLSKVAQTKDELGAAYGMVKASKIGKEWNEQATAFSQWAIGKTVAEVTGMKTKKVDDAHPQVPDEADLTSSVTLSAGDFIGAISKAAANAK